jgi:hypothetical protein
MVGTRRPAAGGPQQGEKPQTRRERQRAARQRQAAERRRRERRRRFGIAATIAVVVVAGLAAAVTLQRPAPTPPGATGALPGLQTGAEPWSANTADLAARLRAIGLPPLSPAEGTAVHIHQHLDIYVYGERVAVPALIGIDPATGYAPLHVHDTSGVVHVESPTVRDYTLGQFFAVWGVRFTPTCIGGYCAGGGRHLQVFVNGQLHRGDPAAITLAPHQEIVVAFGTGAQLPSPIPSSYRFPPGE